MRPLGLIEDEVEGVNSTWGGTGPDNGFYGKAHTAESRAKMSKAKKGKKQTPEQIEARIAPLRGVPGRKQSEETKQKLREIRMLQVDPKIGRVWINNGAISKMVYPTDAIPDGWVRGIHKRAR